jgi:hypothetical protein
MVRGFGSFGDPFHATGRATGAPGLGTQWNQASTATGELRTLQESNVDVSGKLLCNNLISSLKEVMRIAWA